MYHGGGGSVLLYLILDSRPNRATRVEGKGEKETEVGDDDG